MNFRMLFVLLILVAPCIAEEPAASEPFISGWGKAIDPAEDCEFDVADGNLTITVPGSPHPHDLGAELFNLTAPHVIQPIAGDFVLEVKVEGGFEPGTEAVEVQRTAYTGAGLVVFADDENFVRLERAALPSRDGTAKHYVNFEIRVDGKVERFGRTGDFPTEADKPTWLRLERRGQKMLGAMSHDGESWIYGKPKRLDGRIWNEGSITAGVAAVSLSLNDFAPTFSELRILLEAPPAGDDLSGQAAIADHGDAALHEQPDEELRK